MKILNFISYSLFFLPVLSWAAGNEVKDCLSQAIDKDNPIYQVPGDSIGPKSFTRHLVMICNGDAAKSLYLSLNSAATEGSWPGKTEGEVKILGDSGGSSMCYHITRNSDGERSNDYNCSIKLGISESALGNTESSEMTPFDLN